MPRGARRTVPRRAPPHPSAHAPQGAQRTAGRAAYRAARGAAQRRAGRGRRAHRCAAPHRSPERTSAPRRAAAAHALSTSRSVLHTDHLRAAPSYTFSSLLSVTDIGERSCSPAAGRGAEPSLPGTGQVLLCASLSAQLVAVRHRAVAALPKM